MNNKTVKNKKTEKKNLLPVLEVEELLELL